MADFEIGNLIYLVLLGSVVVFWYLVENRGGLGKMVKHMAAWGFIFLGVIAVYGLWGDIRQTVSPRQSVHADQGRIELPQAADGHYYVVLDVNGQPLNFVVDTGASGVVLTKKDAEKAGIDTGKLGFYGQARTANGVVSTAPVRLDSVQLGPFVDRDLRADVNGGDMDGSLLGMSYLQRFDRIEISDGKMILQR